MNDKKLLLIFGKKEEDYKLLKKTIDTIVPVYGREFKLRDILLLDSMSWLEKKDLKKILGGDYNKILAHNIGLTYQDGRWIYENTNIVPHNTIRILNVLQKENKFRVGSTVYLDDLVLIEYLSEKVNEIFEKEMEKELGEKVEGYEINQELLNYVSNDLRQKIGKTGRLDHKLIKAFLESFYEYDEMAAEEIFREHDYINKETLDS